MDKIGYSVKATTFNNSGTAVNVLERLVYCSNPDSIIINTPFVNAGWDTNQDCMIIEKVNSIDDIVFGIIVDKKLYDLESAGANYFVIKHVSTGIVNGIDTSAFDINTLLYVKTDGTFTNDPANTPESTIPQPIGLAITSAVNGEVYINNMASQIQYIGAMVYALLRAKDASLNSGKDGGKVELWAGAGDGTGNGGDVILGPGKGGASDGKDGEAIIKQAGTKKDAGKYFGLQHDGDNAIIDVITGNLKVKLPSDKGIAFDNQSIVPTQTTANDVTEYFLNLMQPGTTNFINAKAKQYYDNNGNVMLPIPATVFGALAKGDLLTYGDTGIERLPCVASKFIKGNATANGYTFEDGTGTGITLADVDTHLNYSGGVYGINVQHASEASVVAWTGIPDRPTDLSQFNNDMAFLHDDDANHYLTQEVLNTQGFIKADTTSLQYYPTLDAMNTAITNTLTSYAKQDWVTNKGYQTNTQVSSAISTALAAYTPTTGLNSIIDTHLSLSAGSYGISISGNAATASTAAHVPWGGVTGAPTILTLANVDDEINTQLGYDGTHFAISISGSSASAATANYSASTPWTGLTGTAPDLSTFPNATTTPFVKTDTNSLQYYPTLDAMSTAISTAITNLSNSVNGRGFLVQGSTPQTTYVTADYVNNHFVTPDLLTGVAYQNWVKGLDLTDFKNATTTPFVKTDTNSLQYYPTLDAMSTAIASALTNYPVTTWVKSHLGANLWVDDNMIGLLDANGTAIGNEITIPYAEHVPWGGILNMPTTITGFGITDALHIPVGNGFLRVDSDGHESLAAISYNDLDAIVGTSAYMIAAGNHTHSNYATLDTNSLQYYPTLDAMATAIANAVAGCLLKSSGQTETFNLMTADNNPINIKVTNGQIIESWS